MEQFRKVNKKKQTEQNTHHQSKYHERRKNGSIIIPHRQMDPQEAAGTQTPNLAIRY